MADAVLTLNAGSSSIKFSLFELDVASSLRLVSQGRSRRDRLGAAFRGAGQRRNDTGGTKLAGPTSGFRIAAETVIGWTETHLGADRLVAVGHRVVHGGPDHHRPELVTPDLLAALDRLTPLAPLHEPHNLAPIRAIAAARPKLPQVACFDTAFHHTLPAVATRFALPREYENAGVRRYGFHGLVL